MIGHTQPRRIAAQAVASRLAAELDVRVGEAVGLEVRFTDQTSPTALVKVMTDGILLNEIRSDRRLRAYDTLIIDEAHERSLNIDFVLGYLRRIERERPDLKVIITSATIDPERFAEHFGGAPIVRVPGRSFPVTVRYSPRADDQDLADGRRRRDARACRRAARPDSDRIRDMLVFLPGERWIRDAEHALERFGPKGYELLPLYARLTTARQRRILEPKQAPRIVLATNIAETSLTVPRIRYVVDAGLARVSRYGTRHRVQSLGVEPIAQANAIQRTGRCGRLAPGICVRLYSEEDFAARPAFQEPEILRTGLGWRPAAPRGAEARTHRGVSLHRCAAEESRRRCLAALAPAWRRRRRAAAHEGRRAHGAPTRRPARRALARRGEQATTRCARVS